MTNKLLPFLFLLSFACQAQKDNCIRQIVYAESNNVNGNYTLFTSVIRTVFCNEGISYDMVGTAVLYQHEIRGCFEFIKSQITIEYNMALQIRKKELSKEAEAERKNKLIESKVKVLEDIIKNQ